MITFSRFANSIGIVLILFFVSRPYTLFGGDTWSYASSVSDTVCAQQGLCKPCKSLCAVQNENISIRDVSISYMEIKQPDALLGIDDSKGNIAPDSVTLEPIYVDASRFMLPELIMSSIISRLDPKAVNFRHVFSTGEILQHSHNFLVRSYGPGSAQTMGARGFTSSQVKVLWNGIQLNHPMLGLTDLSLIPAIFLDEINIDHTYGSSEYGENALGGVVLLESHPRHDDPLRIFASMGSYRDVNVAVSGSASINSWRFRAGVSLLDQNNDFRYRDVSINPPQTARRNNAGKSQKSAILLANYSASNYWNSTFLWVSDSESGIPGSILIPSSQASQYDTSLRINHKSNWSLHQNTSIQLSIHIARLGLDYLDPLINLESLSTTNNLGAQWVLQQSFGDGIKTRIHVGHENTTINTTEYESVRSMKHTYLQFNSIVSPHIDLNIFPSLRYDNYSQFQGQLTYGLGLNYRVIRDHLSIVSNFHKNYSPPTFNDLYWPQLGNPDLVPELSTQIDIGLKYRGERIHANLQFFQSSIRNGIIWSPDSYGRFRPDNINRINNSGVSITINTDIKAGMFTVLAETGWTLLRSVYASSATASSIQNNQVVYQPRHKWTARTSIQYRNSGGFINSNFTGKRFINQSNTSWLDSYWVIDTGLNHIVPWKSHQMSVQVSILNIMDTDYSQIRWYPMPKRTFNISIILKIGRK